MPAELPAEIEEQMAWEEQLEARYLDDPPLASLRGTDPQLHLIFAQAKADGINDRFVTWEEILVRLTSMARERVDSGNARYGADVEAEITLLMKVRLAGRFFGDLIAQHNGSEEAALAWKKNQFKPTQTLADEQAAHEAQELIRIAAHSGTLSRQGNEPSYALSTTPPPPYSQGVQRRSPGP